MQPSRAFALVRQQSIVRGNGDAVALWLKIKFHVIDITFDFQL